MNSLTHLNTINSISYHSTVPCRNMYDNRWDDLLIHLHVTVLLLSMSAYINQTSIYKSTSLEPNFIKEVFPNTAQ